MRQPAIVSCRSLGRLRRGQVEHVLLEAGDIEPPGDDPGAARRRGEVADRRAGPADRQMVVAPVRRLRHADRALRSAGRRPAPCSGGGGAGSGSGWRRPAPARCPRDSAENPPSEVEQPGRAFGQQAGALHVAAHGAQVAMPRVAHDVLVAHALAIRLGDEADAQRMRAQPVEALDSPARPCATRCARIRRTASGCSAASPIRPPVLMRRNSGPAWRLATACQASKARTGQVSACLPARQADLGPLPRPGRSCCGRCRSRSPPASDRDVLDLQRHQLGAAQRAGEAEQQQRPVAPAARRAVAGGQQPAQHGEGQRRRLARRAAVLRSRPRSGSWMSRCAGFHGRSLNRCILPSAARRRRIVVGAWLSARLAR